MKILQVSARIIKLICAALVILLALAILLPSIASYVDSLLSNIIYCSQYEPIWERFEIVVSNMISPSIAFCSTLIRSAIFGVIGVYLFIDALVSNKAAPCTTNVVAYKPANESKAIEIVLRYKELLDNGVISLEEFEEKKKQILGQ